MLSVFLQRLKADDEIGFNYDYMGSAEFEFGATTKARAALARFQIDRNLGAKKINLTEKWGNSTNGPIEVWVFGRKDYIADLGTRRPTDPVTGDLTVATHKSSARFDNPKILGWMNVYHGEPLLFLRVTQENIERGDKFLQAFMDQILEAETKAAKQELYTYANGYTLRRVNGPVYLPKNDGQPIEGNGQWVLFDESGNAVDRDKYRNDIVDRHYRKIGEPLLADD